MHNSYEVQRDARRSQAALLLSKEGRTFALDRAHPNIFAALLAASNSGFPASLVDTGLRTLNEAIARGETLSSRSAELHRHLKAAVARRKVPALLRAAH